MEENRHTPNSKARPGFFAPNEECASSTLFVSRVILRRGDPFQPGWVSQDRRKTGTARIKKA
jgi:hypothetical protein